jgi:hypothetical protein
MAMLGMPGKLVRIGGMTTDELQMMSQRLDRLDQKLDEIFAASTRQQALCEPCQRKLDAVYVAIYGNGREGLLARVERLETVRRLSDALIVGLVGAISGIAVSVINWFLGR